MSDFWKMMQNEDNITYTENDAVAVNSTLNACLDAFGSLGAMRFSDDITIIETFKKALYEDKELAMRLLFYIRDIRGGQGERHTFRVILKWLADNKPELVKNNLKNVFEFGRADDIVCLLDTQLKLDVISFIKDTLNDDINHMNNNETCSLLAKWLPSCNTSSKDSRNYAKIIIKSLGINEKQYRQTLSKLRNYIKVVETKMSANKWETIDYNSIPGKASLKYSDAFYNHNGERYIKYLEDTITGKSKVNANALFPVDIVHRIMNNRRYNVKDAIINNAMWNALPNYFDGKEETGICVVDVSGSMDGTPMEVAISLGLYCANKCKGPYKNKFITFSESPQLVDVLGKDINDDVHIAERTDWGMSTNIESVFNLILNTAIKNKCSQDEMPNKLYIISDMQFNEASGQSNYWHTDERKITFMQSMKQKYADNGYSMPALVYWDVRASDCGMFQETVDGENCCMVSGYSPSLFKAVIDGTEFTETVVDNRVVRKQTLDSMNVMLTTLKNNRYDCIYFG